MQFYANYITSVEDLQNITGHKIIISKSIAPESTIFHLPPVMARRYAFALKDFLLLRFNWFL